MVQLRTQMATEADMKKIKIDFENKTITLPLLDNLYDSLKNNPAFKTWGYRLEIIPQNTPME